VPSGYNITFRNITKLCFFLILLMFAKKICHTLRLEIFVKPRFEKYVFHLFQNNFEELLIQKLINFYFFAFDNYTFMIGWNYCFNGFKKVKNKKVKKTSTFFPNSKIGTLGKYWLLNLYYFPSKKTLAIAI